MPRNLDSGLYQRPAGTTAHPNTTIKSAPYNAFTTDLEEVLNTPQPISMGGTGATTAAQALANLGGAPAQNASYYADSVEDVRALSAAFTGKFVSTRGYHPIGEYADGLPKGGALYYYDASDSVTADNDVTCFVDIASRRWKLVHNGHVTGGQCGMYIDGSAKDDLAALNRGIALLNTNANTIRKLRLEPGTFTTTGTADPLYLSNCSIEGAGKGASLWRMSLYKSDGVTPNTDGTFLQFGSRILFSNRLISAVTQANPCVVTVASVADIRVGDEVRFSEIVGMTELNGGSFTISAVDETNNKITLDGVNSIGYGAYVSGGTAAIWRTDECHRVTVSGIMFQNLNTANLTASSGPALDYRAAVFCSTSQCVIVGAVNLIRLGGYFYGEGALYCYFEDIYQPMSPRNGGIGLDVTYQTDCVWVGCRWSGTGKGIPDSRGIRLRPSRFGSGIDGMVVNGCIWNFNATDMNHVLECDATNPGIANTVFSGGTMDGGIVSAHLFKIGSASTDHNSVIRKIRFNGTRITAASRHPSAGGGMVKIVQESNKAIYDIVYSGCALTVGSNHPFYTHSRSGGATIDLCGVIFNGNAIAIQSASRYVPCATTGNITLSGIQTIDGVAGSNNSFVLVMNQSTASENGIYRQRSGAWERWGRFDDWDNDIAGCIVGVTGGSTHASTLWRADVTLGGTLNSTAINFVSHNPFQNLLEINSDDIIFTGNQISFLAPNNDDLVGNDAVYGTLVGWPFLNCIAKYMQPSISYGQVSNNSVKPTANAVAADVSQLSALQLAHGPIIRNNSGVLDGPQRVITTTDATTTTIAQQVTPSNKTVRVQCRVVAVGTSNQTGFVVSAIVKNTGGTAAVVGTATSTADVSTSWTATIDANSANARVRVTGAAATTINWAVFEFRVEVVV